MPVLTVRLENRFREIPFTPGQSIRDILDFTDIRVRAGCNGSGACGLCRIRIESGMVHKPTKKECAIVDSSLSAEGIRLACQVRPTTNVQIGILNLAQRSNWRNLPAGERCTILPHREFPIREYTHRKKPPFGVAVDLGTTHISVSLLNLVTGERQSGRIGKNPQINSGSDVMTRLVSASGSSQQASRLSEMLRTAIGEALQDIASRDGINLSQVVRFTLVGNTAMLALLSKRNYHLLTKPSHWTEVIDCHVEDSGVWTTGWNLNPEATIEIVPSLAGFIGSDLLAGVLSTHLIESTEKGLFIDFGTNSEIAVWDGKVLRITSTAGGPAFEGSGFRCGIPAEPGAISRVWFRNKKAEYSTITGNHTRGLCGSGIIDLISGLVKQGILTEKGNFAQGYSEGYVITQQDPRIVLVKADVDLFQQAKAAIGAGIQILLEEGGMKYTDLRHIYIGGIFGHFLDVKSARNIGLLPMIPSARIHLCGNTSLNGCELILLSSQAEEKLAKIRRVAQIINLSQYQEFDDVFLKNLYLRPLSGMNP